MQVVLEAVNLTSEGAVTLDMRREFTIKVTAEAAYVNDPAFENAPFTISISELDLARIEHDERFAFLA